MQWIPGATIVHSSLTIREMTVYPPDCLMHSLSIIVFNGQISNEMKPR